MLAGGQSQRLRWHAAAIMVVAALTVGVVLVTADDDLAGRPGWVLPVLVGLVAVASAFVVRVRLQSTVVGAAWTDAAILVCIVSLPPAWVPLCVAAGVLLAKLLTRLSPFKSAYNAAKDALSATVGLAVAAQLGLVGADEPLARPWTLVLVALAVAVTEHVIGVPVLSRAANTTWRRVLCTNADIKLALFVGKVAVALLTLWLRDIDARLLAIVPPVALCMRLLYAGRVTARTDMAAWQRLAVTTESLNATDLPAVLDAAVVNAAELFGADEVEVALRASVDGPVLVRGDAAGVHWSGDPGHAPPRGHAGDVVTEAIADIGEVRLRYAGRIRLTDRERLALRTFASALHTAVRNATAFAEARRLADRNAHAALHDPLTGVANRRRLLEYGAPMLARPDVTALVVLDLDMFREVNETLGHLAGDRLLAEVARRLVGVVGPDDLVARLGGDEFAALLVGLGSAALAESRARELLACLDAPVELDGMRIRVEASAGVAAGSVGPDPADADAIVELLRRADVAMYQAKRGAPRVVRYDASRDPADVARLMLGGDLSRAIADREFAVSFQPIVDLESGLMTSAEALARWHHPNRGDLDPRLFLAAVERSGLLPAFAEAVLDQALAAMGRWRRLGVRAPVAVNASPRSLLDPTFPRMVADRLASHGASGSDLIVELTETLSPTQVDMVGGVLRELRSLGVRLALDDFGTGYSSLAMLAKVPVSELKIDRSFVAAMDTSAEALAVVRSTVELGRSLDRRVVAEGVERVEQRAALWRLGCPAGQGHLFGRPMPIDALLAALTATGTVARLAAPLRAAPDNVIELPRPRRAEGMRPGER